MTTTTVVRYRVRPEDADRNAELVQAVFDELHELEPAGLAYTSFRLEDGTFVHVAEEDSPGRLREIAAFRAFREHLGDRCEEPLVRRAAERLGSYRPG
jgi:hypothetical protein